MKKILMVLLTMPWVAIAKQDPQPQTKIGLETLKQAIKRYFTTDAKEYTPYIPESILREQDSQKIADEFVKLIPEIENLKKANESSAELGQQAEYYRTLWGMVDAIHSMNGQFQLLQNRQNPAIIRLSDASCAWIAGYIKLQIKDSSDRDAQLVALAYNDALKVYENQDVVRKYTGSTSVDHDLLLEIAFTKLLKKNKAIFDKLFPTFSKLDKSTQSKVKKLLTAGSNLAQFGQLESVGYEAQAFKKMSSDDFKSQLIHIIWDIMGSSGKMDFVAFVEPAARTYMNIEKAYEMSHANGRDMYHNMLQLQAQRFGIIANLNEEISPEQIAYTRIATMARNDNKKQADNSIAQFNNLDPETKKILVNELNKMGSQYDPAIKIEYGPALLKNAGAAAQAEAMKILVHIYSESRLVMHDSKVPVITVHANQVSRFVKPDNIKDLINKKIIIEKINENECIAQWAEFKK